MGQDSSEDERPPLNASLRRCCLSGILGLMDFTEALTAAKAGKKVRRALWADLPPYGAWMELATATTGDGREIMPQLVIGYPGGGILRPFAGANWDLLADDWEIAP